MAHIVILGAGIGGIGAGHQELFQASAMGSIQIHRDLDPRESSDCRRNT